MTFKSYVKMCWKNYPQRKKWVCIVAIIAVVSCVVAEPPKEFKLVPARLSNQRDGLGNVFAKLKAGKEVHIAYIGGSVTAQDGWRVKTLKWFQTHYPQAKVSEINAAIGGTGSDLGVYRFDYDVLRHKPDLIFVEFSINDGGTPPEMIWRAMEGIVRQTWKSDPTIDLCFVYTLNMGCVKDLDQGNCPRGASSDEILADYYGIPSINMAMRTAELARAGKLIYTPKKDAQGKDLPTPEGVILFSIDSVHPLDAGHEVYTQVITDALKEWETSSKSGPHSLKEPMMLDNWENAKLVPLEPWMLSPGWKQLSPADGLGATFHNRFPELWEATKPGEKISFKFKGTAVKLYDLLCPDGCQVIYTLDGKSSQPCPRFDWYCTYSRLASLTIGEGLVDAVHTVSVEIHPQQPDRSIVTNQVKNEPGFDPNKYDGTALRVGWIMLNGKIIK